MDAIFMHQLGSRLEADVRRQNNKEMTLINAAVEVLEGAVELIRQSFPSDAPDEIYDFVKETFSAMNLAGEIISAESIFSRYRQKRSASM